MLLTGPLNAANALTWVAEGQQRISAAPQECVIDLANTANIDSAGIAVLLAWKRYALLQKKNLILQHPSEKLKAMLALYGLQSILL